jgi:hypothetical protein
MRNLRLIDVISDNRKCQCVAVCTKCCMNSHAGSELAWFVRVEENPASSHV